MMTKLKISKKPEPNWTHRRLLLWSLLGWESVVALLLGLSLFITWLVLGPFPARNLVLTPLVALSAGFVAISLTMWGSLSSKLRRTEYAELVHLVDRSEDELRAPFEIAVGTSFVSLIAAGAAAMLADILTSRIAQAILVALLGFFVSWAVLATISTAVLIFEHDRRIARVEAIREQIEADERDFRSRPTDE